jgi:hypothetical protein
MKRYGRRLPHWDIPEAPVFGHLAALRKTAAGTLLPA